MILYVTAKTTEKDVTIDYLRFKTPEGREIFVDWDCSDYIRTDGQIEQIV